MRKLFVILAAGLLFLGPAVAAAQSQSGMQGGQTPSRTPSGGQIQSDPSPGRMAPGTQSQTPDTEQVRKAQEKLKAAGFDPGPTDGNLGAQTKEALLDYQKARGLPQTGMLDDATQQALMASGTPGRGTTSGGSGGGTMGGGSGSPGTQTSPGGSLGGSSTPGGSPGGSMGGSSGSESTGGAIRR